MTTITQFLDQNSLDWTSPHTWRLWDVLSNSMYREDKAGALVADLGLERRSIRWHMPARDFWRDILDHAASRNALRPMVAMLLQRGDFAVYRDELEALLDLPARQSWLLELETWLAQFDPTPEISRCEATLLVRRVAALVDVHEKLNRKESDAFVAAAHVTASARRAGISSIAQCAPSAPASLPLELRTLIAIVERLNSTQLSQASRKNAIRPPPVREDLVTELLRLGEVLFLDRVSENGSTIETPDESSPLEAWAAAYTSKIEVERGCVSHVFRVGSTKMASVLEMWLQLKYKTWMTKGQELLRRERFGGVFMVDPTFEVSRSFDNAVPASVLKRFEEASYDMAGECGSNLVHFGGAPTEPKFENLLPLPIGAIAEVLIIPVNDADESPTEMVLTGEPRDDIALPNSKITLCPRENQIVLDPKLLDPTMTYRWVTYRDDGAGPSAIAEGEIRSLNDEDAARWRAVKNEPLSTRLRWAASLELYDVLLTGIWPRISDEASISELVVISGILTDALQWLRANAPYSTQINAAIDLGEWVHRHLEGRFQ